MLREAIVTHGGRQRVWQTLPRYLRRRTMSHNVRRLPVRLRAQGLREVSYLVASFLLKRAVQIEKTLTAHADRKRCRKHTRRKHSLLETYARRQRTHVWLETHIWHSKRMKMIDLWGFRIPAHTSDRGIRAAYRASSVACTIHDASYFGCIQLEGRESDILLLLSMVCPPVGSHVSNNMYLPGGRASEVMLHRPNAFPLHPICPASFMWRPRSFPSGSGGPCELEGETPMFRSLWLWVHPVAYDEAMWALKEAVTMAGSNESSNAAPSVAVNSLRYEFNRFELRGPRAHGVLRKVQLPFSHLSSRDSPLRLQVLQAVTASYAGGVAPPGATQWSGCSLWSSLADLRTPASLPSGSMLALTVRDPRRGAQEAAPSTPAACVPASAATSVTATATTPGAKFAQFSCPICGVLVSREQFPEHTAMGCRPTCVTASVVAAHAVASTESPALSLQDALSGWTAIASTPAGVNSTLPPSNDGVVTKEQPCGCDCACAASMCDTSLWDSAARAKCTMMKVDSITLP